MTTRQDYPTSYYVESTALPAERAPLVGSVRADVCVVGGGIAGCSTALHLAERGYRVVLLEQHRIGWGASGRSGAQALYGLAASQSKLERLIGAGDARRVWDMTLEGIDLMRGRIARHGIDCDWVSGQMHVANKPRHLAELRAWQEELAAHYDYTGAQLLDRGELAAILATDVYHGGLYDKRGGHLHPLRYTLGLAAAAEAAGARIHERSGVLGYQRQAAARPEERVRVRTETGEVRCAQLAFAGNAWLGRTVPALLRRIMPVGTYIVATEPLGAARAAALIRNNACVTDMNWVLDYYRRSADHRLLFGGRVSYSGLDPLGTARATRARLLRVFPQLADARITHSWGGYVDITLNRAPDFGRLAPEVWYLQGFSGHGIVLAGIAGQLLAEAIAGQSERFDVFARIRHMSFYGGLPLRRAALVLAMLWYRFRDWW
ncbi:MAG: FAD-binding oxidoreductase [Gammaproteobacteria bacterium]|nr:FAD-binding oxidoreductase [Gammaproteobacteria bacterium]